MKQIDSPVGGAITLSLYICSECENLLLTEQEPTIQLNCPREWCEGKAELRKYWKVYLKEELPLANDAKLL